MKKNKPAPLEAGLLMSLQAIENQISREVANRNQEQLAQHGVKRWESFDKRIENITSYLLNSLGENNVSLDSIQVLAQALVKTLAISVEDLQESGLGKLRTSYFVEATARIERDCDLVKQILNPRILS